MGCRDCRYCDDYARERVHVESGQARFVERVNKAIARFESGAFRTVSGR
jgi:hypothetical protein